MGNTIIDRICKMVKNDIESLIESIRELPLIFDAKEFLVVLFEMLVITIILLTYCIVVYIYGIVLLDYLQSSNYLFTFIMGICIVPFMYLIFKSMEWVIEHCLGMFDRWI